MKEIVTIQIGHTACFVGTHFWNAQDAASERTDSSVLFREGQAKGASTYAPRLVLIDLRGSFGTQKKVNELYEDFSMEANSWAEGTNVIEQERVPKNEFLRSLDEEANNSELRDFSKDLQSSVKVWSDFNAMYYHPRTIAEVKQYQLNDTTTPFATFEQGRELWKSNSDLRDDVVEERFRFFLEECDAPQGIQVFAGTGDGFSGVSAALVEEMKDFIGKLPIVTFGIESASLPAAVTASNAALAAGNLFESSAQYIPIFKPSSFLPNRVVNANLSRSYNWTALCAAAIDTATLPSRIVKLHTPLQHLLYPLTQTGPLASLASSFPALAEDFTLVAPPEGATLDWMYDWTLSCGYDKVEKHAGQSIVLRGVWDQRVVNLFEDTFSASKSPATMSQSYVVPDLFPICASFPGLLAGENPRPVGVPLTARLRASPRLSEYLERSGQALRSFSALHARRLASEGVVAAEEVQELTETMVELAHVYAETAE
ncbi:tubulin domain-containing protein [Zopfochytrium polystomum]|nr:tubulin domain-containing protein [Zopfochytrium polystomum]